eukprot:3828018-Prymnesium_polylepis.1
MALLMEAVGASLESPHRNPGRASSPRHGPSHAVHYVLRYERRAGDGIMSRSHAELIIAQCYSAPQRSAPQSATPAGAGLRRRAAAHKPRLPLEPRQGINTSRFISS